jgi:protein-S-isoprenylcysteine O-methyltransferase Ste14
MSWDDKRPQALWWVAGIATAATFFADLFVERGTNSGFRIAGVVLLLLAPLFFVPPFFLLKKHGRPETDRSYFCTTRVVDRGVYRVVRHPQYVGYALLAIGFAMRTQHVISWALAVVAVSFFYLQAVAEERFCVRQLGAEYATYVKRVPRFNFVLGLLKNVPGPLKSVLRRIVFFGLRRRCPICRASLRRYLDYGDPPRREAMCPVCGALERHRLIWLVLAGRWAESRDAKFLHLAPEPCLSGRLRQMFGAGYMTFDLARPDVRVRGDVTNLPFASGAFDFVHCSHVLEHVVDDEASMRELARVLSTEGFAVIEVPITADATVEDPTVTEPQERLRLYGQEDHVRRYGPDYFDRLSAAGFLVERLTAGSVVSEDELRRAHVEASDEVVVCRPAAREVT